MMLLDFFGIFGKIWAISGVLRRSVGIPHSSVGPRQGVACPHYGVAERDIWKALGKPQRSNAMPRRRFTPQRSYCSQRVDFCVLFFFAIPLFQGLAYWINEYPISV